MVTDDTKKEFYTTLQKEVGFVGDQKESDEILISMVKYYRLLGTMNQSVKDPQEAKN